MPCTRSTGQLLRAGHRPDVNADFNPGQAVLDYYHLLDKRATTATSNGSEDQKNFAAWREQATKN
jgi:phenol/toluene 2-monooxygenase (NADH) P3/A3